MLQGVVFDFIGGNIYKLLFNKLFRLALFIRKGITSFCEKYGSDIAECKF